MTQNRSTAPTPLAARYDAFRRDPAPPNRVVVTAALHRRFDAEEQREIFRLVHDYDDFTPQNDPYRQHDRGFLDYGGERIHWAIDAYDAGLGCASANPLDPDKTVLVLTVMLACDD